VESGLFCPRESGKKYEIEANEDMAVITAGTPLSMA